MTAQGKKPKNRFLTGAHVSEEMLARILFCWLFGMTHTNIPSAIVDQDSYCALGMQRLAALLGPSFLLAANRKKTISRQATHALILDVSTKIIVKEFYDRRSGLNKLLEGEIPDTLGGRNWLFPLLGANPTSDEKARAVRSLANESVGTYFKQQIKSLVEVCADTIPYGDMRAVPGIQPPDLFENPIILERIQKRYKDFRGFKPSGARSHLAQYMCLRQGADMLFVQDGHLFPKPLRDYTKLERAEYHLQIVTQALAGLLIQLETGHTYDHLRKKILGG